MLDIITSIANAIPHLMEIKHEYFTNPVDPQSLFIDLCDSSDDDGMLATSFYRSKSSM
jgi:hypothetical protein